MCHICTYVSQMYVYVCMCIYIYTWNPNDPCFDWKRPRFQKNRGQTGSRYVLYTNIILSFLSALVPGVCLPSDFSCQKKAELGRKTRGLTGGGGGLRITLVITLESPIESYLPKLTTKNTSKKNTWKIGR